MNEMYKFSQTDGILTIPDETIAKLVGLQDEWKGHPFDEKPLLSRVYRKFSGNYFAPTFVKKYNECPASALLSYLRKREETPVLNLGSACHEVYERTVKEKVLDISEIKKIAKETFIKYNLLESQRKDFDDYVNAFTNFKMYDDTKLMDGSKEHFAEIYVSDGNLTVLDIPLGYVSCLIDRFDLDVKNKVINIVDYKTGRINRGIDYAINTYRTQMMTYAWATRANYPSFEVNCWLCLPAIDEYIYVDVDNLVDQSRWIEQILQFKENKQKTFVEGHYLEQRENQYCKYCCLYGNCSACNKDFNKNFGKEIDPSLLEGGKKDERNKET